MNENNNNVQIKATAGEKYFPFNPHFQPVSMASACRLVAVFFSDDKRSRLHISDTFHRICSCTKTTLTHPRPVSRARTKPFSPWAVTSNDAVVRVSGTGG